MFLDRSMLDVRPFVSALCLLLVGFIATFLYKGYKARMRFVELKRLGMVSDAAAMPLSNCAQVEAYIVAHNLYSLCHRTAFFGAILRCLVSF